MPDDRPGDGLGRGVVQHRRGEGVPRAGQCGDDRVEAEHVTEFFTAFGQLGVRAEDVAKDALCQAEEYLAAGVPVGKYLADQLMLPLGIGAYLGSGGGVFRTMDLSPHATTHLDILRRFLELDIHVEQDGPDGWLMRTG